MYFTWCGTEPSHSLGLHKSHHLTAPSDQVSESVVSLAQPSWRSIPSSWAYTQLHHLTEPSPVSGGGREQQEPLLIIEKQNQLTDGKKTPALKQKSSPVLFPKLLRRNPGYPNHSMQPV